MFPRIKDELYKWYSVNKRDLPWRNDRSPYKIWLSEVILQQTRVQQGISYYLRFLERFPDVYSLARADEQEVLYFWQGLGYYSRARNLHFAANQIVHNYNGLFPETQKDLMNLKGVGEYTAAAIASIVFNEPIAVVDGNVFRVLSRLFDINIPINNSEGKKAFRQKANELLDKQQPGLFNEALMEFGALQCKVKPDCHSCPMQPDCQAFNSGKTAELPFKNAIKPRVKRFLHFLLLQHNGRVFLTKRTENDIWKNLFQPLLIETGSADVLAPETFRRKLKLKEVQIRYLCRYEHFLTHRHLVTCFYEGVTKELVKYPHGQWVATDNRGDLPIPRLIEKFFEQYTTTQY